MTTIALEDRYDAGVLSCYDRVVITGTLPTVCYAGGMTDYFYKHQLRIFDYPKWAEPLRDALVRFERPATVISESPDEASTQAIGAVLLGESSARRAS